MLTAHQLLPFLHFSRAAKDLRPLLVTALECQFCNWLFNRDYLNCLGNVLCTSQLEHFISDNHRFSTFVRSSKGMLFATAKSQNGGGEPRNRNNSKC